MSRLTQVFLCGALALAASGAIHAQSTCNPYYVLADCDNKVYGGQSTLTLPAEAFGPSGIAMSTAPELQEFGYAFVSHASKVHAFHYFDSSPELSIDLAQEVELSGTLVLQDLKAAGGVGVKDTNAYYTQYALYVVGYLGDAAGVHPYYFVLDQQAIIDRGCGTNPGTLVLDHGYLCDGGGVCNGLVGKVEVDSPSGDAADQVAYAAVYDLSTGPLVQTFVKLTRAAAPTGPWTASLDPDNVEGTFYNSPIFPKSGIDFNAETDVAYGLWATTKQVTNLDSGADSCALPGHPVDIAIRAFDDSLAGVYDHAAYRFIAVQDAASSSLIGFPEGQCPDFSQPTSISIPIAHKPVSMSMGVKGQGVKLIVGSEDGTLTTTVVWIDPDGPSGDELSLINQLTDSYSCIADFTPVPSHLCGCTLTDDDNLFCLKPCDIDEHGNEKCPDPPKPPRCLDPNDPACVSDFGPKP